MFQSSKVKAFLQSCKFAGEEDKPALDVAFYITPLSYDLLYEVSDRIAKQLFRREGSNHVPVSELGLTVLNVGELGSHNFEFYPHDQKGADEAGQMIPSCKIGKVSVDKLFTDDPNWSLIFKVSLPLDSNSLALMHKYFKKNVFLTLEPVQDELFDAKTDGKPKPVVLSDSEVECPKLMQCEACKTKATYLCDDTSAWCAEHVHAAPPNTKVRQVKYATEAQ